MCWAPAQLQLCFIVSPHTSVAQVLSQTTNPEEAAVWSAISEAAEEEGGLDFDNRLQASQKA